GGQRGDARRQAGPDLLRRRPGHPGHRPCGVRPAGRPLRPRAGVRLGGRGEHRAHRGGHQPPRFAAVGDPHRHHAHDDHGVGANDQLHGARDGRGAPRAPGKLHEPQLVGAAGRRRAGGLRRRADDRGRRRRRQRAHPRLPGGGRPGHRGHPHHPGARAAAAARAGGARRTAAGPIRRARRGRAARGTPPPHGRGRPDPPEDPNV
ncbi:MAG: Uncharacterized MFS-type transporter, partial [uncultured Gemmatimonadetes bacterium]